MNKNTNDQDTINQYERAWTSQEVMSSLTGKFSQRLEAKAGQSTDIGAKPSLGYESVRASGVSGIGPADAEASRLAGGGTGPSAGGQVPPPPAFHPVPRLPPQSRAGALEVMTANGQTIKLEGEYEEVVGPTEIVTRRIKEQDKVIGPKFPTINTLRPFHNQIGRNLVLASGRTDGAEVKWWNEILQEGSKFEDFANTGDPRHATLDLKLHCTLNQCIKEGNKTLATQVASMEDEAMKRGEILKGRQLGWLIHNWFRISPDMKPLYGLQEITDLKWMGDDKIFEFLHLWKQIVENNVIQLTEPQLAEILVGKMKGHTKVLEADVAYWFRLPAGNEQKTHQYLLNSMQSHLDRVQMEKNNEGRRALLQGGRRPGLEARNPSLKKPCYFFNHGGCSNTDDKCRFAHVIVPDDEKAKMVKPVSGNRSPSPKGRGKGGGVGGTGPSDAPRHCHFHVKGTCTRGDDCPFPHINKDELERQSRARAKAKAQPKGKAEPKAAPKAAPKAGPKAANKQSTGFARVVPVLNED